MIEKQTKALLSAISARLAVHFEVPAQNVSISYQASSPRDAQAIGGDDPVWTIKILTGDDRLAVEGHGSTLNEAEDDVHRAVAAEKARAWRR